MATSNGNDGDGVGSVQVEDALSRKRKSVGANESHEAVLSDAQPGPSKKAKLGEAENGPVAGQPPRIPSDRSALPVEIWLHIFSFCPPRTLGNLLCVNKLFNSCLDLSSKVAAKKPLPSLSVPAKMTPQNIWQNARRCFWPNMPGPLDDKSEIDMWRLACSSTCQFCGKRDTRPARPATLLRFGPGPDGVAPIWAFRVRCCGDCLLRRSLKEMEFLLSEGSSFLMPALQCIFVTPEPCLIPLSIMDRVQLPSVPLSKLFWTADVEGLRQEFVSVKELGAPAVEEWQKGLSTRGAEQRANIAKWEKYAESGGVANMRTLLYPGYQPQPPLPVAHTRSDAAKASDLQVVKTETRNDSSSNSFRPAQTENANHTPPTVAQNIVAKMPPSDTNTTDKRETTDADWDEIQGPVRLKILKYADEAIIGDWDDGEKVTSHNAPSFAADVLLHVRSRFYRQVEKDAAGALASGHQPIVDPPKGPFTQKLTLENMKYVFDVKVKPITEKLRKELFLCHECVYNSKSKFFGFEGVVQHYASKHTTALSVGNVVVHWRAEWPKVPPFKPDPRPPKNRSLRPPSAIPPRSANPAPARSLPPIRHSNIGQVSSRAPNLHPRPQFPVPQSYPTTGPDHVFGATPFGIGSAAAVPNFLQGSSSSQVNSFDFGRLPTVKPPGFQQTLQQAPKPAPPLLPVADRIQPPSAPAVLGAHGTQNKGASAVVQSSAAPSHLTVPVPFAVKLNQTAKWALTFWQSVSKVNHLPVSLRLYLVIYHLDKKFRSIFKEPLPISLYIDGMARHRDMQPLRNINALYCRACQLGLEAGAASMGKSTEFSMIQLANHFMTTHMKGKYQPKNSPPLDWITDMLFLPQQHLLRHMLSPGDTWYPQLIEAINHLVDRQEKQTTENPALRQKAATVRGDSYSPQYNVASLSMPETSLPSKNQTKRDSDVHDGHGTTATEERQHSSRDKPKSAHQSNEDGHGMWQQHWEFSGFRIKGTGTEQESENAEKSERQQEEAIRAMWAADRVQTAQAQSSTSTQQATKFTPAIERGPVKSQGNNRATQRKTEHDPRDGTKPNKARPPTEKVAVKEENESPIGLRGVPMFSKKVARPTAVEPDLLGALETHLNETQEPDIPEARAATAMRRPPAGPAAYVGERGREGAVHYEPYLHQAVPYEGERRARYAVDTRRPEISPWERPRSPVRQATHPHMAAPMEHDANGGRSTVVEGRRYGAGELPYEARAVAGGEVPDGYVRARTRPARYHDYAYDHGYDHERYGEDTRRALPPVERPVAYGVYQPYEVVEDYEVVRVHHPDGDYYARRPVWRERVFAGAVGEQHATGQRRRYYSEVPAPAPWPSMAAGPAAYEADGRMMERRREYSGVLAPPAAGYDVEPSGRGRERVAGATDGLDTVMGGYYEGEYDPRQPATTGPGEEPWPMRYQ